MAPRQKKSKATRAAEKKQSEKVHAEKQKAHRSFLQSEKDIVPKFQQPPPDHFGHQNLSPLWKFAVHIDWPQFSNFISSHDPQNLEMYKGFQRINDTFKAAQEEQEQLAKKSSPNKTEKLLPFSVVTKRCVLCPLCLQNPDTPLSNAIIMLSRSRPSNIKQHTDSTGGTSTDTGNVAKQATEVQASEVGNTDDTPSNTQDTDTSYASAIGNEKKKTLHLFEDTEQAEYLLNILLMKATKALDDFNSKAKKSSEQDPLATNSPDPTYEYFPDLGDGEGEAEVPMTADDIQVVKIDLSDVSDNEEDKSVVEDEDIDNDEAITFHLREEIERLDCLEKSRKLATEEKKKRAASKDKDKGTNVEPTTGTSRSGSKKRKANETPPVQKKAKQTKLKSTGSKSGSKKKPSSRIKSKEDRESQSVRRSPRAKKKKGATPESAVRVQDSEAGSDTEENVASNLEHMLNEVVGDSHGEENDSDAEYSNEGERDDTGDNDNREEDEAEDSASE